MAAWSAVPGLMARGSRTPRGTGLCSAAAGRAAPKLKERRARRALAPAPRIPKRGIRAMRAGLVMSLAGNWKFELESDMAGRLLGDMENPQPCPGQWRLHCGQGAKTLVGIAGKGVQRRINRFEEL